MGTSEAALGLAKVAQEASTAALYERHALDCLRQVLDFEVGFFVRASRIGPGPLGVDGPTLQATRSVFADYGRELLPVVREASGHGLAVDREVLGTAALDRTRVYREFMRPQGGRCTLLAPLVLQGRQLGMLVLGRRQGRFTAVEKSELQRLLPTLRLCDALHASAALCAALTPREQEVLQYLCLGYTNGEIARGCGTSVNTVRNQLQRIYRRLGATTRAEAVALVLGGAP